MYHHHRVIGIARFVQVVIDNSLKHFGEEMITQIFSIEYHTADRFCSRLFVCLREDESGLVQVLVPARRVLRVAIVWSSFLVHLLQFLVELVEFDLHPSFVHLGKIAGLGTKIRLLQTARLRTENQTMLGIVEEYVRHVGMSGENSIEGFVADIPRGRETTASVIGQFE